MDIDQNKAVKQIAVKTEFDEQIVKLSGELNKTYVAYGKEGKAQVREPGRAGQERGHRSAVSAAQARSRRRPSAGPRPRPALSTATPPGTSWTR